RRRGHRMKRREFITLLAGAAAWPLAARAQPSGRMRRIGILMHLASDDADAQSRNAAFLQGLQELGWAVGRNVRIDYRWGASNFDPERMRKGAVELVALAPDVVLYRVLKSMTLGRFPNGGESDSTRRTEEVRHVGSDTITPGF